MSAVYPLKWEQFLCLKCVQRWPVLLLVWNTRYSLLLSAVQFEGVHGSFFSKCTLYFAFSVCKYMLLCLFTTHIDSIFFNLLFFNSFFMWNKGRMEACFHHRIKKINGHCSFLSPKWLFFFVCFFRIVFLYFKLVKKQKSIFENCFVNLFCFVWNTKLQV